MTLLDFLYFWICWYIPLKNLSCIIIALYLKQFQRYGSPISLRGIKDQFHKYDDKCLFNVFKTIPPGETCIIGRKCFKYSKFLWFSYNDLDLLTFFTQKMTSTFWPFWPCRNMTTPLKFFVHKGEGLYTSHSKYHFWSIVYSCIFGHIIFPYIYIPYIYTPHC